MKRLLLTSLILILVMCVSSFATRDRVMVMGDNNTVLVDDYNITEFYGRTFNYPNIAVGEFGNSSDFQMFGINWKFGEEKPWVLGTYFGIDGQDLPEDYLENGFGNFTGIDGTHPRNIDLFYGRELGGHKFGFHLGYHAVSFEDTDTLAAGVKESAYLFDLGFGLTDASDVWDVALTFTMGGWTDEDSAGVKDTDADGYYDFGLAARYFYDYSPVLTFIPHAEFSMGKRGEKNYVEDGPGPVPVDNNTLDLTTKSSNTEFVLGVGLNCTPSSGVLAVGDFGFSMEQTKQELTWTATYLATAGTSEEKWNDLFLPFWKIGLEAEVLSWMDVRMGATSDWESSKWTQTTTFEEKEKFAHNHTYLGFGFNWGRLHVDTYSDPEVFLDGFDFISGDGDEEMNWNISVLYEMF